LYALKGILMFAKSSSLMVVLILLAALLLTACAAEATPTPTNTASPPTDTATPVPPTATPTASPSPPPTATATYTPSPSPTVTDTPVPPSLTVLQNAVCRSGPGDDFAIVGYFTPDEQPPILGVAEMQPWMENPWWYVEAAFDKECYISDAIVSVTGDTDLLPQFTPMPTPTPKPVSSVGDGKHIFYFLTAPGTGGPFGCGASLFYITTSIERTGDPEVDIAHALNALFANHNKYMYDLYNPLYSASLHVSDVDVVPGGDVIIHLSGNIKRPQDKCERILIHDQIWNTITLQFPGLPGHPVIWKQGTLLGDILEP
jgi:hypothetical protein